MKCQLGDQLDTPTIHPNLCVHQFPMIIVTVYIVDRHKYDIYQPRSST
jgi:hypothetical protein